MPRPERKPSASWLHSERKSSSSKAEPPAAVHPHLHLLVTEGGVDQARTFHRVAHWDDPRLADLFTREVLRLLLEKELLSLEWAERILSWRHTGFNVHSRVWVRTKAEAERVGRYMVRPVLALDRLLFLEREEKVGYRWGRKEAELETIDYHPFCAWPGPSPGTSG